MSGTFDTLAAARRLEEAGMGRKQAYDRGHDVLRWRKASPGYDPPALASWPAAASD